MNLKIANRLLAYRRAHGLSQEELAEKIGVSRQAVSKWERAEASPDTDNLIALASLYGVLIDELINGEGEPQIKSGEQTEENTADTAEEKTEDNAEEKTVEDAEEDASEDNSKKTTVEAKLVLEFDNDWIFAVTAILCSIAYLAIGFLLPRGWACGWIVFMLVPVIPSLVSAIVTRRASEFLFPVFVTGLYLTAGMCFGRWHPDWIIFLTVPIYYIVAEAFEGKAKKND